MKKKCELCNVPARIFCESDQASLCWDCDAKVHAANFLVARHSRTLLCHHCDSPTPWKASGVTLGNTVSLCYRCAAEEETAESKGGNDDGIEVACDDDGDNQFVAWSSAPPPPPESSEESVTRCSDNGGDEDVSGPATTTTTSLKRQREDNDDTDRDFQV